MAANRVRREPAERRGMSGEIRWASYCVMFEEDSEPRKSGMTMGDSKKEMRIDV